MDTQPFATQNKQLALALATAGVKFAHPEVGGPTQNLYSLGFLRSRKIGKGKHIEAAVREAVERKIPGKVTYLFEHDENLERVIKGWDGIVDELQKARHEVRDPVLPNHSPLLIAQVMCVAANNVAALDELAFINTPLCSTVTGEEKHVEIEGKPAPKSVFSGVGKVWSLGASRFIKDRLGIK
jgi:hypothetical protein